MTDAPEQVFDAAAEAYLDAVRATMSMPGWREAMWTRLIWGDTDPYGGPEIGERATRLMPDAGLVVVGGAHAPFVDDPVRCAEAVRAVSHPG